MKSVPLDGIVSKEASEIEICFEIGAWKAAYMLAGSALERILVTHFVGQAGSVQARTSMELCDVIAACGHDQRLAKHEAEIGVILRGYGSIIRSDLAVSSEECATRCTAAHAMAVLQKVSGVIPLNLPRPQQPQTAEEIVILAVEPGIDDITVRQLILAAPAHEVKRLLLTVIPEHVCALLSLADPVFPEILLQLRDFFDLAFCFTNEEIKRAVVKAFMAALDEQETKALVIQTALFRPKYLLYLDRAAQKRMLRHLLARLQNEMSLPALQLVDGLEEFLFDRDDLLAWLRTVVIACLAAASGDTATEIREYAKRAYESLRPEQKRIIAEKQEVVFRDCERDGNCELGRLLRTLQDDWAVPSANPTKAGGRVMHCNADAR
jgi:hypothetical protein